MSMSSHVEPWLWQMLGWGCGINQGRTAHCPKSNLLVSAFTVLSETGKIHQIKTISTGFQVERAPGSEDVVLAIKERRLGPAQTTYLTRYADGSQSWLRFPAFFSDDGTVTSSFLSFCSREDLEMGFKAYSKRQLQAMCAGQTLRSTGAKQRLQGRLQRHYFRMKGEYDFTLSTFQEKIGELSTGDSSHAGTVRRFYTDNYSAVDRFDRLWYETKYPFSCRNYETYFAYCLLHQAVINAWAAWCTFSGRRIPIMNFIEEVVSEYTRKNT
jgi:hypothetical protein